jgi:HEAT repeat protein
MEGGMSQMNITDLIDLLTSQAETVCEAEAIALGASGAQGLPTLKDLLAVQDADVRFWALRGLWANGSAEAVALLGQALQDGEEMVRSGAAVALGELKAEAAIAGLARLASTDPGASGNHAGDALSKIGRPAAPALIEAMQHPQAWVRRRAAKALIPVESKQAIPVLFKALEDESYMVRYYTEIALVRMGVGQMVYFKV